MSTVRKLVTPTFGDDSISTEIRNSPAEQEATRANLAEADHMLKIEGLERSAIGKRYDQALIEGSMTHDQVVAAIIRDHGLG